jgi:hypothetical protein
VALNVHLRLLASKQLRTVVPVKYVSNYLGCCNALLQNRNTKVAKIIFEK